MGKWATIFKGGKYIFNNPATRSLGGAVIHPQRTLVGAGRAVKTATVGAGVGYLGWEALVNDKPVVRTVADIAIGSDNVDAVVDTTSKTVDSVQETVRDVKESVSGLSGTVQQANSTFGGISDFLKNVCGGNGFIAYGRFDEDCCCAVVVNCSDNAISLSVPVWELGVPRDGAVMQRKFFCGGGGFNCDEEEGNVRFGRLFVTLPEQSACVYYYNFKDEF